MSDVKARIDSCFANVFPGIPEGEIHLASAETLPAWDSLANIRLLSAIGEEFGLELDMDDYVDLVSYPLIVQYVENKTAGA